MNYARLRLLFPALVLAAFASACKRGDPPVDDSGDEDVAEGIDPSVGGSTSGEAASADDDGIRFDASNQGEDLRLDLYCDYIDFVFVVDNSKSMADEQQNLVEAVPGFVEAMKEALPSVKSFRVGVVDTDSYPSIGPQELPIEGCPDTADCSNCDYRLGAFMSKAESARDPGTSCNFSSGMGYMDGQSPSFAEEFECAALVGTQGNPVEQQIGALTEAISPTFNQPGGCNEGFLRDNALLVFLVITDEEDDGALPPPPRGGSQGEPQRWYDAVLQAKDGKPTNMVALGLIGDSDTTNECPELDPQTNTGAELTPRLHEFIGKFDINFVDSVCSNGYEAFFRAALEKVSEGCEHFIP